MKKILKSMVVILLMMLFCVPMTKQMANAEEKVITIKPLQLETPYTDFLEKKDSENWYQFDTKEAGYFSVHFAKDTNQSSEWRMELYDSDKDFITSFVTDEAKAFDTTQYGYDAGSYYIKVYAPYASTFFSADKYQISVNFQADQSWEKEKQNDSFKTFNSLDVNKEYHGNLYRGEDADFYQFQVTDPGYFNVEFQKESNQSNEWRIELYDNDKDLIGSYITSDLNHLTTQNYGYGKGNYYVKIDSPYPSIYYNNSTYSMKVNYKQSATWEQESNNTREDANKITFTKNKGTKNGTLYQQQDVDYYKFKLNKAGKVTIQFAHDYVKDGQWRITLMKKDGTELEVVENKTATSKLKASLKKGTYYVAVQPNYATVYYSPEQYKMTVNVK